MNLDQLSPSIQQRLASLRAEDAAELLPCFHDPRGSIRMSLVNTDARREAFQTYRKSCGVKFALCIETPASGPVFVAVEKSARKLRIGDARNGITRY